MFEYRAFRQDLVTKFAGRQDENTGFDRSFDGGGIAQQSALMTEVGACLFFLESRLSGKVVE